MYRTRLSAFNRELSPEGGRPAAGHALVSSAVLFLLAWPSQVFAACTLTEVLKFAKDDEQAIVMFRTFCQSKPAAAAAGKDSAVSPQAPVAAAATEAERTVATAPEAKPAGPTITPSSPSAGLDAQAKGIAPQPAVQASTIATPPNSSAAIMGVDKSAGAKASDLPPAADFFKGWGVGLALMRNKSSAISDASVVNGIVRANAESRWQPELLVAKHYYFHHEAVNGKPSSCLWESLRACPGLFLGVGFGGSASSQVIDMIGGGVILGFGGEVYDSSKDQSHNVGLGIGRRFNIKSLGDGLSNNAPLPAGETQIRYKITDLTAPFLFYTYKFN